MIAMKNKIVLIQEVMILTFVFILGNLVPNSLVAVTFFTEVDYRYF